MEIERKFIINTLPYNYEQYRYVEIEQGYISTNPVIRVRKKNDSFILTCKSRGLLAREEVNLIISEEEYLNLKRKVEHKPIFKRRYYIPLDGGLTAELDLFLGHLEGLQIAEVEFDSLEAANAFVPPDWFSKEVTNDPRYQNCSLCQINSYDDLNLK